MFCSFINCVDELVCCVNLLYVHSLKIYKMPPELIRVRVRRANISTSRQGCLTFHTSRLGCLSFHTLIIPHTYPHHPCSLGDPTLHIPSPSMHPSGSHTPHPSHIPSQSMQPGGSRTPHTFIIHAV